MQLSSIARPDRQAIRTAADRIRPYVRETPVIRLPPGEICAGAVWLKLECLQLSGSFKARGAFNTVLQSSIRKAGLIGEIAWGWLHIDILWVDERVRGGGVGSDLLTYAEDESIAMDSPRAYLETTDFQALGFYQKQGYEVFAELPDQPPGHTCYYLKKELRES